MTPLATAVLGRLTRVYGGARDPDRGPAMAAYMRDQFPFLGIQAPVQRVLAREVLDGLPRPSEDDLRDVAEACWALPEREYQYFACGLLRRHARACSAGFLETARFLAVTKPWWDTVDILAAHLVGALVSAHPALVSTMDEWVADKDKWLVRTAILHQLRYKERTDAERLFRYCTRQAGHTDFFVRKAIGWALREYAKTEPAAVRTYVAGHRLAPLSAREALKNL
ncbi:DNA alkylation repair protein [Phytohabitans sp. ZYX-F-186]|uniref:DNA alkylation repair protein n=1 Tax=Phytohabitans maris TaxID=3071409 RepID=A0ABU0ZB03_9ACTN|nr:DNA alkylation repair protein [Phytohabitans sp. ZYX-F-186]MDQ7904248.1 DNA alkylation repair protein [Phytohabitans sp. ZYX-F-186]